MSTPIISIKNLHAEVEGHKILKGFNLEMNAFQTTAIPEYEEKIRVYKVLLPHSKSTVKAFKKSLKILGEKQGANLKDSLLLKTKYVSFQLVDFVAIVKQLNAQHNKLVIAHLKKAPDAKFVSTISMNFERFKFSQKYIMNSKSP
mgnify:CR=1 FL=1